MLRIVERRRNEEKPKEKARSNHATGSFNERREDQLRLLHLGHLGFSRLRGFRSAVLRDDLIQRLFRSGFLTLFDLVVRDCEQRVGRSRMRWDISSPDFAKSRWIPCNHAEHTAHCPANIARWAGTDCPDTWRQTS